MATKRERTKRPTQADVARLARVSQPTVSHVLNNNMSIAVPPETRQRVLEAIDSLGYIPDRTAQRLRTRKTYTLASIIPDITNPFYPAFQRGIQDIADQHRYDLLMYNTDGLTEKERKCLQSVLQGPVDGVVAVLFHMTADDLRVVLDNHIAVVRLEARGQETGDLPLDSLYVDNRAAAYAAVSYLITRGHTQIAMIAGQQGPREARVRGYQEALFAHRIPINEQLIESRGFTETGGYSAMHVLLQRSPRPTAVFAANDLIAIGAMIAIREAGLAIPHDVAVIGFDDIPVAKFVTPALTTIAQHPERLGRRAAEMLFERLQGTVADGGRSVELPYELIVRGST